MTHLHNLVKSIKQMAAFLLNAFEKKQVVSLYKNDLGWVENTKELLNFMGFSEIIYMNKLLHYTHINV